MKSRIGERVTVNGYPGTITSENDRNVCVAFGPALGVRWVLSKHALKVIRRPAAPQQVPDLTSAET